ncbi:hypothetical protein Pelo_13941 [Pelomyxa schiedti]|nr:hypothetical protein Pelo_13941 [Pelomyxa schiedti]
MYLSEYTATVPSPRGWKQAGYRNLTAGLRLHVVLAAEKLAPLGDSVDLATWKLMFKLFPGITRAITKKHFMGIVVATPHHAQFTMNMVGITLADIEEYTDGQYVPHCTAWWLKHGLLSTCNCD